MSQPPKENYYGQHKPHEIDWLRKTFAKGTMPPICPYCGHPTQPSQEKEKL